ncbi:MAG: glycosyltransferase family 4 protein, partial [Candidatus Margulisbacteria bacterium]|nr:glycosyltransferase family 4 protein [Candidatus Margulisiibacteriota bacterium]
NLYKYTAENVEIISAGVYMRVFKPRDPKKPRKIKMNKPYIFCLSRIDANKGHDQLLRAFSIVKDKVPGIDLVIGGGSPNPKPREEKIIAGMKDIVRKNNMEDRVHIIGYVPDELLVPYYQEAEFFVSPSIFEPLGMTSQEAMACGKAVLASSLSGIRFVITSSENGILADPHKTIEFAEAMIKLIQDDKLRKRLGDNALDTVKKKYSWIAMAKKFIDFYSKYYK